MLRLIKKQGFTLIELMVVIVIIGVLASLAIPRFTDASVKAKVAEAPRVIASYESAYLAATAEVAEVSTLSSGDLIFSAPSSRWWSYSLSGTGVGTLTASANESALKKSGSLISTYESSSDTFIHDGTGEVWSKKYVANFMQ